MPHITVKNMKEESFVTLVEQTTKQLAVAFDCPEDWIVFYHIPTLAYTNYEKQDYSCYIDVEWFDRGMDAKKQVVKILDDVCVSLNKSERTIYFHALSKEEYFENQEQF